MSAGLLSGTLIDQPRDNPAPGLYIAAADTPAYGWLEALALTDQGTFEGVKYASGRKYVAVRIGASRGEDLRPNALGQIRVGPEYFTKALREYEDWKVKWWREAIQNGVDAGATEIECIVDMREDRVIVSVADNGTGMTEETLLDKFLVFGGTTKTGAAGTRGGFGVAKELLVLPWMHWKVHTRDRVAQGEGIEYEVSEAPHRQGTLLEVEMPPDQATSAAAAVSFIEKCELPDVHFRVIDREGGERVYTPKAALKCGKALRDFAGKAILCHNKKVKSYEMHVRTMGLYMFGMYAPSGVEGTLLIELTGSSIELLTSNRDGFRDKQLKRDVESYASELAADVKSALRAKQGLIREKFHGTGGKYSAERDADLQRARILDRLDSVAPQGRSAGRKLALSDEQLAAMLTAIAEGRYMEPEEETGYTPGAASPELAKIMLAGTPMAGPTAVEAAAKQLAWRLDFLLVNNVEGFHVPAKFRPDRMTKNVRRLARLWGELCRFVLIQLGSSASFGIGFIFDESVGAQYEREYEQGGEEHWLLLNPLKNPRRVSVHAELLSPSDADDLGWLYAAAVHECTHMADGITYHDESFAAAMTRNVARTSGKEKQIRAIKRLVAEQERAEAADRPARAPREERGRRLTRDERRDVDATREFESMQETRRTGYRYSLFIAMDDQGDDTTTRYPYESRPSLPEARESAARMAAEYNVQFEIRDGLAEGKVVSLTDPVRPPP